MLVRAGVRRLAIALVVTAPTMFAAATPAAASGQEEYSGCAKNALCTEVAQRKEVFGDEYVGHDEPSAIFYSNRPGAGNRLRYTLTIPSDPSPHNPNAPGKSYNFELGPTFWFGMALCDTESYPEQVSRCKADSDRNITSNLAAHPGAAFTEIQFYSPGWVGWPVWEKALGATTCDPTRWCAAMNVFSLLEDPVNGTLQNDSCAAKVGIETWNFAFVTRNGRALAPANPLDATLDTFTPDGRVLFMNPGDRVRLTMHDTPSGLRADIDDLTNGRSGSMTASPANGFAHIKFDPTGDSCQAIPYAFHPMYSTASEQTRVPWAAHSYNVGFSEEIGHFQHCDGATVPSTPFGLNPDGSPVACPAGNTEEDGEPTDGDDNFCFPASSSELVQVQGCTDTNTGFDGMAYKPVWPDGNTVLHPTPVRLTSPLTGRRYQHNYSRMALEADLPAIEGTCDTDTGAGCTHVPITDDGAPADFYPYYSITRGARCQWQYGGAIPNTATDFGRQDQWGPLLGLDYLVFGGGGATQTSFEDFRNILRNPCPA
ncbi:MAG TPA: hypothetical protein VH418_10875 [Solirubrobacteraceae bacterium]|jgi:hypothetical protein